MYSSCRDIRLWFIVFNGKSISRIYCLVTWDRILHTSWKSNLAQSSKAMLFRGKYLLVVCEKKNETLLRIGINYYISYLRICNPIFK